MAQGRAVTTEDIEKLLAGLRLGMTRRAAASHAGFSKTTLYRMLENDADGTLVTEIEKAEAHAEGTYTGIIAAASEKNWQAAAWWLERRHPQDYAKRERVEMSGPDGGPIESRDVTTLPDHERAALAEAIRSHLRGEEGSEASPAAAGEG